MKFRPGRSVVLQSEDGVELRALPFFYTTVSGGGLSVELYTESGARLRVVDEERGVYTLGNAGLLTIKSDGVCPPKPKGDRKLDCSEASL